MAATSSLLLACLVASACSLNPQPLPPDQPTDSGGMGTSPPRAGDGGTSNAGQPDATIPAVDSGSALGGQDAAAPAPGSDAAADTGPAGNGGSGDGGVDGAETDAAHADGESDASHTDEDAAGDTGPGADAVTEASPVEDSGAVDTDAACTSCPDPVCGSVGGQCIDEPTCIAGCPDAGACIVVWEPEPSMGCGAGLGCCYGPIAAKPSIMPYAVGPFPNDFSATVVMPGLPCAALCYTLDGTVPQCLPSSVPSEGACGVCTHGQLYDPSTGVPIAASPALVSVVACYSTLTQTVMAVQAFELQVAPPTLSQPAPGNLGTVTQGVTLAGASCGPVNPNASPPCFAAAPTFSTATNPSASPSDLWIVYTIAPAAPPTCTTGTIVDLQAPLVANRIGIAATTTVQAIGCKTGYLPSAVVIFDYVVASASTDGGP